MADLSKVKRNIQRMIDQNAPEADIDAYVASEGTTPEELRAFKAAPSINPEVSKQFATQAAGMDPTDLSIARSKNDGFGQYLRDQARLPMVGEAPEAREARLYGQPMRGPSKTLSSIAGAADMVGNGFGDEIAAGISAMTGPEDYNTALTNTREAQRIAQEENPNSYMAGQVAGGVGSMILTGGASAAPKSGWELVKTGAKTGGFYGGLYGGGSAEGGWKDRVSGAVGGTVAGTILGAGIPIVAKTVKSVAKPAFDAIYARFRPEQFADQKILQRIISNGSTAETLANKMAQNPGSAPVDVGPKSLRTLLRTATNIPGPAKDRVTTQLNVRQFGQGDRIKDVISKTFADPDTYIAQREAILGANKKAAAPLWKTAEAQPVHFSQTLEDILETPAGKAALAKAETLAANEQEPFKQIFVNVMQNGKMVAKRVPDIRGWQQVKVALDDMINAQKDPITRQMSNEGRILVGLKNRMLSELDASNPAYAVARKASATGKQLDDAINVGKKSLTMSPEALKRELAGMNPAEREAARVGAAEALRAKIDAGGFTHNSAIKVMGGRQQAKNLEMLFESKAKFAEARKAVFAEMRKRSTYETVTGNSTSAAQLADMADAGGLQDATQFATQAITQGPINATFSWIGSRLKMMGGLTPRVADEIAKKLMTTNPKTISDLTGELMKIEKSQISSAQKSQAVQALLIRLGAMSTAATLAPNQQRLN